MKCPLFIMGDTRAQMGEETEIGDCNKEECAWWVTYDKSCVLVSLNNEARVIRSALKEMEYKMPHSGQFTG